MIECYTLNVSKQAEYKKHIFLRAAYKTEEQTVLIVPLTGGEGSGDCKSSQRRILKLGNWSLFSTNRLFIHLTFLCVFLCDNFQSCIFCFFYVLCLNEKFITFEVYRKKHFI
jgi:hypothetical protein